VVEETANSDYYFGTEVDMGISLEQAKRIGTDIGIDWEKCKFPPEQLRKGIEVEFEHGSERGKSTDLIGTDPKKSARIAWSHLKEFPDYYTRLDKMEEEGKKSLQKKANGDDDEKPGKPVDASLVAQWFREHPNPPDEEVHEFAEAHGYNPHELESVIYRAATQHYKNAACKTPGKKIKSKGEGRGMAHGEGGGPLGIPVGKKKEKKMKKSASYELGVRLALEDLRMI
jgi:hypothetical protein